MERPNAKTMISAMPMPGTYHAWSSERGSLDLTMDIHVIHQTAVRDDGDEECYHEYYAAEPFGRVTGTIIDSSKSATYYQCSAESFENDGFGAIILILQSLPEDNPASKTVYEALPYLVANLYGIFPDIIISMPIP